jgi:hypothetical protein
VTLKRNVRNGDKVMKSRGTLSTVCLGACLLLILSPSQAQDTSVRLTASISLEKRVVTQHEPVVIDISLNNPSKQGTVVNLGSEDEKLEVKVLDPEGNVVRKPRAVLKDGWASPDVFDVPPGAASVGSVDLNSWFRFDKTGTYRIDITLSATSSPREPFSYTILNNSVSLDLTVLARDEQSLESACSDLLARTEDLRSPSRAVTAARALSNVNDPVAVPFLVAAMKGNEFKGLMIDALARLKTDQAIQALISASRSSDPETRSLAHSALISLGMGKNE